MTVGLLLSTRAPHHGRDRRPCIKRVGIWLALALVWAMPASSDESVFNPDAPPEAILDALLSAPPPQPPSPRWHVDIELRTGGGHAENVLYSPFTEQDSGFATGEAELFAIRQSDSPHSISLYAFGSRRHYFDIEEDNDEYSALAQGGWEYGDASQLTYGLRGDYYYFDQFFDSSVSDVELDATRLKQHDFGGDAYIRYRIFPALAARLGGGYAYSYLEHSSDDYGQRETTGALEGETPSGLKLVLEYRHRMDDYNDRLKRTAEGSPIAEDTVAIVTHQFRATGAWYWDRAHRWRTRCQLTMKVRDDDGGGYYDYDSWRGGVGLQGRLQKWRTNLSLDYADTRYDVRPADILDPGDLSLQRRRWHVWFHLERDLTEHWAVFTDINWEDNDANDPLDVYRHASAVLGIGYALSTSP